MSKAMIIADLETAEVFRLSDFDVESVSGGEPAEPVLLRACSQGYDLIFISENVAESIQGAIRALQQQGKAIVIVIPGIGTTQQLGERMLAELRKTVAGL